MTKRTAVFFIQGEGRGHLTQAMSLYAWMQANGIEVTSVCVGMPAHRKLPAYFLEALKCRVVQYQTFEIIFKDGRSISRFQTVVRNTLLLKQFFLSRLKIRKVIKKDKPDFVVNFFEPLAALSILDVKRKSRVVSLSHQNLFMISKDYLVDGYFFDSFLVKLLVKFSISKADHVVALSHYPFKDQGAGIVVCPPLIREMGALTEPVNARGVIVYIINSGYLQDVIELSRANPGYTFQVFVAGGMSNVKDGTLPGNLTINDLDGTRFIEEMKKALYVLSTSGFETAAEAITLKKRYIAIPVEGHFEQLCNGYDIDTHLLGVMSKSYRLVIDEMNFPDERIIADIADNWYAQRSAILDTLFGRDG